MTTLDPKIEALIARAREFVAAPNVHFHYKDGAEVMAGLADALSSLPAQAVGFGPGDDSDPPLTALKYIAEDGSLPDKTRRDARVAAAEIVRLRSAPSQPAAVGERHGIYIASKTKHAARWRALRDQGVPVISTWIDEAGEGESQDLRDLWRRCLAEPAGAAALIVYREPDEVLKGGWIELGAAASHDVPVFAVGIREFTISNHEGIRHFDTFDAALEVALRSTP